MMPDDLDSRVRRAFAETTSAWQPNGPSAADVVGDVRRRQMKRRRTVITTGCSVGVLVALAVGTGVYSTQSRTDNRQASGTGLHRPSTSTRSASAASPGPSNLAPQQQATSALGCASVTVDSGVSRCAGVIVASPSASSAFSTANGAAGATSATSAPASVTVKVGQHVAVSLPPTPAGSWREPVMDAPSRLSAPLRHDLSVTEPLTHPGVMRVVGRVRAGAGRLSAAVFEAVKPGEVVLTTTLVRACAQASTKQTTLAPPSCAGGSTQWILLVVVSR